MVLNKYLISVQCVLSNENIFPTICDETLHFLNKNSTFSQMVRFDLFCSSNGPKNVTGLGILPKPVSSKVVDGKICKLLLKSMMSVVANFYLRQFLF